MLPAERMSSFPEAAHLAAAGYRVLTFDLRGYRPGGDGGCSEGQKDVSAAPTDLAAALASLRTDGRARVGLIGASVGGTAALMVPPGLQTDLLSCSQGSHVERLIDGWPATYLHPAEAS